MLQHYLGKQKAENCVFSLKRWMLFANKHKTQNTFILSYYRLVTAELFFILTRFDRIRTKQNLGTLGNTVCYHTLIIYQVCRDVGRCVKSGSCSLSSLKWKVNELYWWDTLLSQQILAVIKYVGDNIICLLATQRMYAPVHGVPNTVQQLLRKTLSFISPELWPQQARAELNWLKDLGSP